MVMRFRSDNPYSQPSEVEAKLKAQEEIKAALRVQMEEKRMAKEAVAAALKREEVSWGDLDGWWREWVSWERCSDFLCRPLLFSLGLSTLSGGRGGARGQRACSLEGKVRI